MQGKCEMKRNYTPFIAGMVTMSLLIGLISASFAANTDKAADQADASAASAQVSVGLFGREMIAKGATLTTGKGGKIPKILAYNDSQGEVHYYIEATTAAELFDVSGGVNFNEELNRVEFGGTPPYAGPWHDGEGNEIDPPESTNHWHYADARHDFNIFSQTDETGNSLYTSEGFPLSDGGFTISVSTRLNVDEETNPEHLADLRAMEEKSWARTKELFSTKPEYGKTTGMFTEVNPDEMNLGSISGRSMDHQEFQDGEWIEHTFAFTPKLGKYAAITIENVSPSDVQIALNRPYTVGDGTDNTGGGLSCIYIPAGGKITRAFRLDETKFLENSLKLRANALGWPGVHLKLSAEQYRTGK